MSSSKMKGPPSVLTMIPNSKSNPLPEINSNLPAPTPTRTTRPSSPLPRSPISVSRTPLVDSKKDFDASVVVQKPNTPMRVAPTLEKSSMMSNYSDIVNANSVEAQLEAKKYVILDRIITNEDGVQVNYIKAYDPNGVIVYILMDSIGNLSVSEDELKPMMSINESKIRVSDKMAASTCAGTGICGVALICNDEICMMVRNNDGTTGEKSYQSSTPILNTGDNAIAHIIVRMSEILADPEGTLMRSFEANERVMRAAFHSAQETLNRSIIKARLLQEAIESFIKNRNKAYENLEKEKMRLSAYTNKYYMQYVKGDLDTVKETRYAEASLNLYARNKVFLDLISITNMFSEEEDEMERTCNAFISLNNEIVEKHQSTFEKMLSKEDAMKL
jgi:predicted metal-dependent enzyme (double-stranded beta helix superfamily)